jgi:hypothetical protein
LGVFGNKKNGDVGQLTNGQRTFLSYFDNDIQEWQYFIKTKINEKYRNDCNFYDILKYRNGNATIVPIESISESCYKKIKENSKVVFIWGDSHAQQLYYGLINELPNDFEVLQVASSGCKANLETKESKANYCEHSNWFAFNVIEKLKPEVVVIGQNLEHDIVQMKILSDKLKNIGVSKIIFTGPSPHWIPSLPVVLARRWSNVPDRTYSGIDRGVLELDVKLKIESTKFSNFDYISLIDFFCNVDGCLTHYSSDVASSVTSWDYGHLTPIASRQLAKEILVPSIVKN